jgi:hypothetical protein
VQVQLGQQLTDFFATPFEARQQLTLKAFLQATKTRPAEDDGAIGKRQAARLAMAVAVTRLRIDRRTPLAAISSEKGVYLSSRTRWSSCWIPFRAKASIVSQEAVDEAGSAVV